MAAAGGGWLKMRKSLENDVRVHRIALRLKLCVDTVLGKLFRLWAWADTHAGGEDVDGLTLGWINAKVNQAGFAEELCGVGWIVTTATGFKLVNFAEHNWQAAKDKALAASRQEAARRKSHGVSVTPGVTRPLHERDLPIPLPEPREDNKTPLTPQGGEGRPEKKAKRRPEPKPLTIPAALDTPAFRAALERWQAYRREMRKPLTPTGLQGFVNARAAEGHDAAIRNIDHSIANGWQGCHAPQEGRGPAPLFESREDRLARLDLPDSPRKGDGS